MSLRTELIQAGAEVLHRDRYEPRDERMTIHELAAAELVAATVLDAFLGVLTEHADEWADYSPATDPVIVAHREIIALKLLAVLRGE